MKLKSILGASTLKALIRAMHENSVPIPEPVIEIVNSLKKSRILRAVLATAAIILICALGKPGMRPDKSCSVIIVAFYDGDEDDQTSFLAASLARMALTPTARLWNKR